MKLHTFDSFLTNRSAPIPQGNWRGVAIHPTSEVDLVEIGGALLTVGSVAPLTDDIARAVRYPCGPTGYLLTPTHVALDGGHVVGEKLVLALYESCDALVPLGPRAPVFRHWGLDDAALPAAFADAQLVFRVPMHGRKRCVLSFERDEDLDLYVFVLGRRAGTYATRNGLSNFNAFAAPEDSPYSWRTGGVPPAGYGGVGLNFAARQLNIENERFDELLVYAYGTGGGSSSSYYSAEAFGEGNGQ